MPGTTQIILRHTTWRCRSLAPRRRGVPSRGTAAVANDDAGGTEKPRRMGLSSGAV